ncbi:phenylalanine--tRNA ligase subunit beta [Plantactinospora sp. GCM10030261]|uniref:phenylalanine--tRNA ligase subunit beta n=1 Tax=Plantactinospora sp. GCM10030261 TaxID=3273420 RepID=UPI003615DFFB
MKVSLEWISDYVDLPAGEPPEELAHRLTLHTVEVEDVHRVADDAILEIDNKSLTNRPDLWGHHGIARELAAIYGVPLRELPRANRPAVTDGLVGDVDPAVCARFAAVSISDDGSAATPGWLGERLARIGETPVSPLVDLSNYVMFTVGQPSHVYEADRSPLSAHLGEVLGAAGPAVTAGARDVLLAVATFRPGPVRQAALRLGLRTEASVRFEKGLDTQRVDAAVDLFLHLLPRVAPGAVVRGWQNQTGAATEPVQITVDRAFLDRRIGESLPDAEVLGTLRALGFAVTVAGTELRITVPTWRSTGDVTLPHDIVEEVARIHGYDRLTADPVRVDLTSVRDLRNRPLDRVVREQLAGRGGLQEVITYPWTADRLLTATGGVKDRTVRFLGAPAPDRDSLRPSLVPNLLAAVAGNLRYRPEVDIFEVGTVFETESGAGAAGPGAAVPPVERRMLGVALAGDDGVTLFRRAKGLLDMLRRHAHVREVTLVPDGGDDPTVPGWADGSARVAIHTGGRPVGTLALVTPRARRLAGVDAAQVACVELDLDRLTRHESRENRFRPVPDLPGADFDLSVVVPDAVPWARVEAVARAADPLVDEVSYLDEYRGSWVPAEHRSVSLRLTLRPTDRTLTAEVVGAAREAVLRRLGAEVGARLR